MCFLTSRRMFFRTWNSSDRPYAVSLWTDPEVGLFLGGPMSPDAASARLDQEMNRQRELGIQYWPVFLKADAAFAGCAGLRPFHQETGVMELGVHIVRPYWGLGLGDEAARTVIKYAFEHLGAKALTAGHNPEHMNSRALIQRLGFAFTHTEPWGPLSVHKPLFIDWSGTKPRSCLDESVLPTTATCASPGKNDQAAEAA